MAGAISLLGIRRLRAGAALALVAPPLHALGTFPNFLLELAKNPAMIYWLDNNGNHKGAINENWGRELLELFSMGVRNYSEDDI